MAGKNVKILGFQGWHLFCKTAVSIDINRSSYCVCSEFHKYKWESKLVKKDAIFKSAATYCTIIFALFLINVGLNGCGDSSGAEQAMLPGIPDFEQSGESIILAWERPENDGENDTSGYRLYYGTVSGRYSKIINVGNYTSCSVDALSPGTWYFAVTAYDRQGNESEYSNEVSYTLT